MTDRDLRGSCPSMRRMGYLRESRPEGLLADGRQGISLGSFRKDRVAVLSGFFVCLICT